jgi:hypothetical protein
MVTRSEIARVGHQGLGIAALVLGGVGLLAGGTALARGRRS